MHSISVYKNFCSLVSMVILILEFTDNIYLVSVNLVSVYVVGNMMYFDFLFILFQIGNMIVMSYAYLSVLLEIQL